MEIIDGIRKKYDPLADLVRPHITLVFPFEAEWTNEELADILENRLAAVKPFTLKLQGIAKQVDSFGYYLFLNVWQGAETLSAIHNVLYKNEFHEYDLGLDYVPHITLGKLQTAAQLDAAYSTVSGMSHVFTAVVDKISVEMIGEKEESIIVVEKKLQ